MQKLIKIAALIVLFATCSQERPVLIIPEEKMISILKEMHIAHAGIDQTIRKKEEARDKALEFNRFILEKYKVTPEVFYQSYNYYQDHPLLLDSMYVQIIAQINADLPPLQQRKPNERPPTE